MSLASTAGSIKPPSEGTSSIFPPTMFCAQCGGLLEFNKLTSETIICIVCGDENEIEPVVIGNSMGDPSVWRGGYSDIGDREQRETRAMVEQE